MSTRAERRKRKEREQYALSRADTSEQRRITAHHESAHGVLAEMYSIPVDYISVVPGLAPKDHPEVLRARLLGAVAIRMGGCQLQRENGIFVLKTPNQVFFNGIGLLASFTAEERIGVPLMQVADSCNGDRMMVLSYLAKHLRPPIDIAQANKLLYNMAVISTGVVHNAEVWQAIERVAALLIEKGRVEGEEVRRIVREVIPESLFFSPERQRTVLPAEFSEMFEMGSFDVQTAQEVAA
jgi:hypothetical protein